MNDYYCGFIDAAPYDLQHFGIKGMKWGIRRWQNADGSYNAAGRARYGVGDGRTYSGVHSGGSVRAAKAKANSAIKSAGNAKGKQNSSGNSKLAEKAAQATGKKGLSTAKKVAIGVGVAAGVAATAYGLHVAKKAGLFDKENSKSFKEKVKDAKNVALNEIKTNKAKFDTYVLGKNEVDRTIKADTSFKRIQTEKNFQDFGAYYATYEDHDVNEYTGLFGRSLKNRAGKAAETEVYEDAVAKGLAEKITDRNGRVHYKTTDDIKQKAKQAKEAGTVGQKIYQVGLGAKQDVHVASTTNASKITHKLMRADKDGTFKSDLEKSIDHELTWMKRPTQQKLLRDAKRNLQKDPSKLTDKEKTTIYKALNLTLTSHEDYENNVQAKFYKAMRDAGYDAIDDINDQSYSSFHAKRPMIIFNTAKTAVDGVREVGDAEINKNYTKYNAERVLKEVSPVELLKTTASGGKVSMDMISRNLSQLSEGKKAERQAAMDQVVKAAKNSTLQDAAKATHRAGQDTMTTFGGKAVNIASTAREARKEVKRTVGDTSTLKTKGEVDKYFTGTDTGDKTPVTSDTARQSMAGWTKLATNSAAASQNAQDGSELARELLKRNGRRLATAG